MRSLLIVAIAFLSLGIKAQNGTKAVELEEIVNGEFAQKTLPPMTFMADGVHYARLENAERIVKYSLKDGQAVETLMSPQYLEWKGAIAGFKFSADNRYILFWTDKEKVYRHSFLARYYLYDTRLKRLSPLADEAKLQAVALAPDNQKVAYVKDNNIYIYHAGFKTNRQVTEDGEKNKIINGVPDWVYEEEFSTNRMMEWSPDSRFLAWVRFDESKVAEFSFPLYQDEGRAQGYLDQYVYKYPKAGTQNSEVSAYVFDYENKKSSKLKIDTESEEVYLPRIFWSKSADKLGVARLNRHQNDLQILFVNPKSGLPAIAVSEHNDRYIDQQSYSDIVFLEDGEHFVYQSERDGYNHLYLYNMSGRMIRQLTQGPFDVTAFYGYDAKAKKYYYQAAKKSPLEREVYALNHKNVEECLSPQAGTNAALFSPNFQYSIRTFSASDQAFYAEVYDRQSTKLFTLVDNDSLTDKLATYAFRPKTFFTITTERGDELNAWMVKPVDFDENKSYPLLMTQYSGPGSQQVKNSFAFGWEQYLARKGYLVVCVDGRGTGFRGEAFKKCTYRQLGRYESDDQISAAKYLGSLPYVDAQRIGIWGWSYGGFMSALCMSRSDVFKAGIAVAPVTHYKFYDTIYTERFMRTPQENPEGYDDYSPLMLAEHLSGRLLLVHGTADDNVHFQNTIDYAEALVQAGKQFEMQIYRNRNHSIYGGQTRMHLYHRFVDFLERNL